MVYYVSGTTGRSTRGYNYDCLLRIYAMLYMAKFGAMLRLLYNKYSCAWYTISCDTIAIYNQYIMIRIRLWRLKFIFNMILHRYYENLSENYFFRTYI